MAPSLQTVTAKSVVTLAYRVSSGGIELESASAKAPVSLRLGQGDWPVQLELALMGELPGACLSVTIGAAENAFGSYEPERVQRMDASDFEGELPEAGTLMAFALPSGEEVEGLVIKADTSGVEVDFNHPYAGRDVVFELEILAVAEAEKTAEMS